MKTILKQTKSNITWSFLNIFSKVLSGLIISIIIARAPNIEIFEVGQILYAVSLGVVISVFVDYGLDIYIIKEIASKKIPKNEIRYFLALRLLLAVFIFVFLLVFLVLSQFTSNEKLLTFLIVLSYIIAVLNRTYLAYFQSQNLFNIETTITFFGDILLLLFIVCSLHLFKNINYIGYSYLFARILMLAVSLKYIFKLKENFFPVFDFKKIKFYIKESFSFALLSILATASIYIDTLLLRFLSVENGNEQVAYFQIAMQFVMGATILPVIVDKALLPILSENNKTNLYFKTNNILMSLGVLVSLFIVIYAKEIISFVYGDRYSEVSYALQIVGIVIMMRFGKMYNMMVTINGNNWYRVIGSSAMLIVGIVANYVLIPLYGYDGSAIASILSHIATWSVYFYVIHKMGLPVLLGWNIKKFLLLLVPFVFVLIFIKSFNILLVLPLVAMLIVFVIFMIIEQQDRQKIISKFTSRVFNK